MTRHPILTNFKVEVRVICFCTVLSYFCTFFSNAFLCGNFYPPGSLNSVT